GGRGAQSRRTPAELAAVGEATGLDGEAYAHASRLVAKVDSAAVQDGFDLYLHAFILSAEGKWCVVQQGMNPQRKEARRYHWASEGLQSFFDSPHSAIEGRNRGAIVNLADARARQARRAGLELVHAGPDRIVGVLRRVRERSHPALDLFDDVQSDGVPQPHLSLPMRHDVRASDVVLRRLHGTLAAAADRGPQDFTELLLTPGVGARTVAALALVAEVIYGVPARFSDPARFSLAHGGKDGHPFPVPLKVYDETLRVLKQAVEQARLGNDERLAAIRRLDAQSRRLERLVRGPSFEAFIAREREQSHEYGGKTVF